MDSGSPSTRRHAQEHRESAALDKDATVQRRDEGDTESEYDEEEYYVVATLPAGAIKEARKDTRGTHEPHYALIDMDTERPLLEIEGTIFQGAKDELLGTAMLFDTVVKDEESEEVDTRLVAATSKVVSFNPVSFIRRAAGRNLPKKAADNGSSGN
ncbi:hypothetical protein H4R20_000649 [Coemansia guatemalensis]|uniref:Transcription factor TFIIIC triple barrel domain-containing protein n=1 Tax=Coemansia guatemalensis TaxID=2761395 RepID=A0A9W8HYI7_9FUNG|nr:hypothetical protein H4R20_000649 [Coemansia guatemalensis]